MSLSQKFRNIFVQIMGPYFKIVVILVLILVAALGYFLFLDPKYQEVRKIGVLDLDAKKNELKLKEEELTQLKSLEVSYQKMDQSQIKDLEKILPHETDFPGIISQMEALAADSNLTLTTISLTEGGLWGQAQEAAGGEANTNSDSQTSMKTGSSIYVLNVAVNFSGGGTYEHLKLFLDKLEENMRILDLSSLNFSPGQEGYTLNLKTYYLK